jgi:hypothetical protein
MGESLAKWEWAKSEMAKSERPGPVGRLDFFEKRQISEQDWAAVGNYSPRQSHLRDANAMIARSSGPGLDGGTGGVPRPGPALGEEQVHFTPLCGQIASQGR